MGDAVMFDEVTHGAVTHDVSFDRVAGVLLGAACADALGAGYEFGPPTPASAEVLMRGQGAFAPGEWTDDTAQLLALALAAAAGHDLSTTEGEDAVAANLQDWYLSPARLKDIGIHSAAVFGQVATVSPAGLGERFRQAAREKEAAAPGTSGGNGALMRTAAVAMALWSDPRRMVRAAIRLAAMTHDDDLSSQACAVWCLAIRAALIAPVPADVRALAARLEADVAAFLPENAPFWRNVLGEAWGTDPVDYYDYRPANGYSVTTLRAAWAAVTGTAVPEETPALHLRLAVEAAVRGGGDTDTVACVAGALLGAMWGCSAVPPQWRSRVHGWPDFRDADLLATARRMSDGRETTDPTRDQGTGTP